MRKTRLVNLTPHEIRLRDAQGEDTVLASDPRGPARLISGRRGEARMIEGIPVPILPPAPSPVKVTGLPPSETGVFYVVASMVLASPLVADRHDLLAPGTGPDEKAVRSPTGQVVAVTRLVG